MNRILVVDDDQANARTLQLHLKGQGYDTEIAHDAEAGLTKAEQHQPNLVILDIRMPGRSGLDALPDFKKIESNPNVVMITAFHDMETTIEAMQKGAEDYIHKPVDITELDSTVTRFLKPDEEDASSQLLLTTGNDRITMVGRSRAMKEVFKTIGLVARNRATVLISGESGTGKELVAHAIHKAGNNPAGPFIIVNCAAIVSTLLESDMFGHEKGAFTGAVSRQAGKFALAEDGSIFLDEIGELSLEMQAKLLRVLQYKEFTPLGARQTLTTNARIIAATNVNLEEKVRKGEFREDLYYRLQVVNIDLPPLRERMEDLPDLVNVLLKKVNRDLQANITGISNEVMECFEHYHWPGNVRQLENLLMKVVALSSRNTVTRDSLPEEFYSQTEAPNSSTAMFLNADSSLADIEKAYVEHVLANTHWHRGQACEILGVSRPRLRRMITDYQLQEAGTEAEENMQKQANSGF